MFGSFEAVRSAIARGFGGGRVLVVGDLMLDVYLWGDVARISPEAPVPIVRLVRRSEVAGGAGNVILNLTGLGLEAVAAGFVGDDEAGGRLRRLLAAEGTDLGGLVSWAGRPTITKTRVIGGHQQMLRLDEEAPTPPSEAEVARLRDAALGLIDDATRAVVLSDYAKGALPEAVCRDVIDAARRRGVPVLVDPKGRDFRKYAGATTLTPNRQEMEVAAGVDGNAEMLAAGRELARALGLDYLVVTLGDKGIRLFDDRGAHDFPALAREVFDVSGAGDSVIATLTAGLVAGLDLDDALRLANVAAGVVVGKVGTTPIRAAELLDAVRAENVAESFEKLCDAGELARRVAAWRSRGERVVFTNGCFDLLHVGHVTLLARARREGDRLVVGLNSDRSVRALKGPSRPVVTEEDRARVLAGLSSVDAVALFDEETPLRLIELLGPDILVKGGDYTEEGVVGGDVVKARGGRVVLVPLVEGRSTTGMIARGAAGGGPTESSRG